MPGAAPAVTVAVGEFFTAQEKATRKRRVAFSFYARVPRAGAARQCRGPIFGSTEIVSTDFLNCAGFDCFIFTGILTQFREPKN